MCVFVIPERNFSAHVILGFHYVCVNTHMGVTLHLWLQHSGLETETARSLQDALRDEAVTTHKSHDLGRTPPSEGFVHAPWNC